MTCGELTAVVVSYLDGELDEVGASACRGHLRVCAACRQLATEHERLRDALVELPAVEPPPALWAQINARLGDAEIADGERSRWGRWWRRVGLRLRPIAWPAAVTASAIAIAVVVVNVRRSANSGDRPGAVTPVAVAVTPPENPAAIAARPAVTVALRDAREELDDQSHADDERFRATVAELLTLAREQTARWPRSRAGRFDREVERRMQHVLAAAPGRDRARSWHALTAYLEQIALGEQVASIGGVR